MLIGNVTIQGGLAPSFVDITTNANISSNNIELIANIDKDILESVITGIGFTKTSGSYVINTDSNVNWATTQLIKDYINKADDKAVKLDTSYGETNKGSAIQVSMNDVDKGLKIQSPNGAWWLLTVDNSGNLITTSSQV